jgi:hypothetical protein
VAAAVVVLVEAVVLVGLAVATLVSGLGNPEGSGPTLVAAQTGYYVLLGAGVAACGVALLRGRRWGRTPSLVLQVVAILIGIWLVTPSDQLVAGPTAIVVGLITAGLLLSPPTNAWVARFPTPFAAGPPR